MTCTGTVRCLALRDHHARGQHPPPRRVRAVGQRPLRVGDVHVHRGQHVADRVGRYVDRAAAPVGVVGGDAVGVGELGESGRGGGHVPMIPHPRRLPGTNPRASGSASARGEHVEQVRHRLERHRARLGERLRGGQAARVAVARVIPAATPARTPYTLSSTTTQRGRLDPHRGGGVQEQVGGGLAVRDLGGAEDPARRTGRRARSGRGCAASVSWVPLEATQVRTRCASRPSSSASTPSTAVSSRVERRRAARRWCARRTPARRRSEPAPRRRASWRPRTGPSSGATTSAGGDRPAELGQHPGLDPDGEPLGVDEDAVAVEDHQGRVGSCVRSSGGRPARRRRRRVADHDQLVGQVDGGADVVGHDPQPAAERRAAGRRPSRRPRGAPRAA